MYIHSSVAFNLESTEPRPGMQSTVLYLAQLWLSNTGSVHRTVQRTCGSSAIPSRGQVPQIRVRWHQRGRSRQATAGHGSFCAFLLFSKETAQASPIHCPAVFLQNPQTRSSASPFPAARQPLRWLPGSGRRKENPSKKPSHSLPICHFPMQCPYPAEPAAFSTLGPPLQALRPC